MAETKDDITAQRDQLAAENDRLKVQLAAVGRPAGVATPAFTFQLSEGDRQELMTHGFITYGGRILTRDDVQREMAAAGQEGVDVSAAPEPDTDLTKVAGYGPGVRGVDFVYPSTERGKIDPAVAGTPGISGPAADGS
jgi:hypothetical protein